jgi:hypothetical protein
MMYHEKSNCGFLVPFGWWRSGVGEWGFVCFVCLGLRTRQPHLRYCTHNKEVSKTSSQWPSGSPVMTPSTWEGVVVVVKSVCEGRPWPPKLFLRLLWCLIIFCALAQLLRTLKFSSCWHWGHSSLSFYPVQFSRFVITSAWLCSVSFVHATVQIFFAQVRAWVHSILFTESNFSSLWNHQENPFSRTLHICFRPSYDFCSCLKLRQQSSDWWDSYELNWIDGFSCTPFSWRGI